MAELKSNFLEISGDMTIDVFVFLKEWWLNHILTSDMAYVPYTSEGGGDQLADAR